MEIVVRGRNVEVPEHYRQHVEDKVGQLERFDGKLKLLRMDVELFHEKNPRQSGNCQRVEITLRGKGQDRKSTRLNSSHANISYAVFCLKKKTNTKSPPHH